VYRTDNPDGTAHGTGSAIIASSQIHRFPLPNLKLPTMQATNISISLNHIPTTISAVYCPSRPAISSQQSELFLRSLVRHLSLEASSTLNTQTGVVELTTPEITCFKM